MAKIQKQNLFAEPQGWTEIKAWINLHRPEERAHLYVAAMMAWNLAAYVQTLPEQEEEKENVTAT